MKFSARKKYFVLNYLVTSIIISDYKDLNLIMNMQIVLF